jgi:hypothetical protein
MKNRIILILILFLCLSISIGYCTDYTLDSRFAGAWLFTEGSGTSVDDSTANSNVGTFQSSGHPSWDTTDVSFATSGAAPNSVYFNGTGDYINVTTMGSFGGGLDTNYLIATTRIKTSATAATSCMGTLNDGTTTGWNVGLNQNNAYSADAGKIYIFRRDSDNVITVSSTNDDQLINDGNWHHVVWMANNDDPHVCYFDGVSKAITRAAATNADNMVNFVYGVYLGGTNSRGNATVQGPLVGYLTDTAIGNDASALSSTEVNEIYDYGLKGPAATTRRRILLIS